MTQPSPDIERALSAAALAASCALMAAAPILVRLSPVDPTATLWLRMVIASGLLICVLPLQPRPGAAPRDGRGDIGLLLLAGLLSSADLAANHWAAVQTSVANTALLMNLSPLFVALLAFVLDGKRPSAWRLGGFGVAIVGAIVMTGAAQALSFASLTLGDALALLSAALYAGYLLVVRRLRERWPAGRIMLWTSTTAVTVLGPVAFLTSNPLLPHTVAGWLPIAALAIGLQIGGHGLMTYAMRGISASLAAASGLARPVLAAAGAWAVLGEAMELHQLVGAAVILVGLMASLRSSTRPVPHAVLLSAPKS